MADIGFTVDQQRMVRIRRQLHAHPERGWELEQTTALVKAELEDIGIPYEFESKPPLKWWFAHALEGPITGFTPKGVLKEFDTALHL